MKFRSIAVIVLSVLLILSAGCVNTSPSSGSTTPATSPQGPAAAVPSPVPDLNVSSPTPEELVAFVNKAAVYAQRVGKPAALREFGDRNGSFSRGDLFIFAYDFNATNLAAPYNPEFVGHDQSDLRDADGTRMILAQQDAARNGSGFISYRFPDPITGEVVPKIVFVKKIDDSWYIGSAIPGTDFTIPGETPEMVRDILAAKVNHAAAFAKEAGQARALAEFNNASSPFAAEGRYIFAFDMNGTTIAMPFLKESLMKNERDAVDPNGVAMGEQELQRAASGGGYFYYVYPNPDTGKAAFKVSYVVPVDSTWGVGAGKYLPDIPAEFTKDQRDRLVSRVGEAAAYVKKNGRDAAIREFNDPNGSFSQADMFVFAFDRNGTLLANPYLPGIVGMNRLSDRDPYGEYPVPYIIRNAENGGGFLYYFFADPSNNYEVRLKLGYSQLAGDDLVVGAGIFPQGK